MDDLAIRLDHVYKRFRRGELYDSLRDLVPGLVGRGLRRWRERELDEREFWAMEDICLQVRRGDTLGIIGDNGAGKSTLLKHLAGIMQPTRGTITVSGRLSALIEVGAGFHPDLTGRENVFLNGVILGMSRAEIAGKFDEIVAFSGVEAFIDTPVKRYSSGMYARLGFSVAAHLDPDILVIDEVLSVGDFAFQAKSLQKMQSMSQGGATVVFVSHNLHAVSELCARTVLIDKGRLVAEGPTADVIRAYTDRERAKLDSARTGAVLIRSVTLRGADGPTVRFEPGDMMLVDVAFEVSERCAGVDVILAIHGDDLERLLDTSTGRLGAQPVPLESGQTGIATFELYLHLAKGTFHVAASLWRYDTQQVVDSVVPAATFQVRAGSEISGPLHAYPRLAAFGVHDGRAGAENPDR